MRPCQTILFERYLSKSMLDSIIYMSVCGGMALSYIRSYAVINSPGQLDETYVRVEGKWHYLYRAINKRGETVDFFFSHKRNKEAAYQFLKCCLRRYKALNELFNIFERYA
ncbi:hypothetical protein BS333_19380 [Vibrio azureus]|nr:hypothetical protein BS333_19380 [Vibrio azureus]